MKKLIFNEIEYELMKDYRDAFTLEDVKEKFTDYFEGFDYILGDYSYDRLRLKGFCEKDNSLYREINDFKEVENYLNNFCSFGCRYFILKKVKKLKENA